MVWSLSDFISISRNSPQISIFSSIDSSFRRLTVGIIYLLLLLMTRSSFRIRILFCLENRRRWWWLNANLDHHMVNEKSSHTHTKSRYPFYCSLVLCACVISETSRKSIEIRYRKKKKMKKRTDESSTHTHTHVDTYTHIQHSNIYTIQRNKQRNIFIEAFSFLLEFSTFFSQTFFCCQFFDLFNTFFII